LHQAQPEGASLPAPKKSAFGAAQCRLRLSRLNDIDALDGLGRAPALSSRAPVRELAAVFAIQCEINAAARFAALNERSLLSIR